MVEAEAVAAENEAIMIHDCSGCVFRRSEPKREYSCPRTSRKDTCNNMRRLPHVCCNVCCKQEPPSPPFPSFSRKHRQRLGHSRLRVYGTSQKGAGHGWSNAIALYMLLLHMQACIGVYVYRRVRKGARDSPSNPGALLHIPCV